jgi:hypothetical protein
MGPAGLTAVFGMGTGGTPQVWSPEKRPGGGQARPGAQSRWCRSRPRRLAENGTANVAGGKISLKVGLS